MKIQLYQIRKCDRSLIETLNRVLYFKLLWFHLRKIYIKKLYRFKYLLIPLFDFREKKAYLHNLNG